MKLFKITVKDINDTIRCHHKVKYPVNREEPCCLCHITRDRVSLIKTRLYILVAEIGMIILYCLIRRNSRKDYLWAPCESRYLRGKNTPYPHFKICIHSPFIKIHPVTKGGCTRINIEFFIKGIMQYHYLLIDYI